MRTACWSRRAGDRLGIGGEGLTASALATFRVLVRGDLDADAALASAVGCPPPLRPLTPPRRPLSNQRGRATRGCGAAEIDQSGSVAGGPDGRRSAVGPADPRVQPEHRQGLMTISMPDRFRLAAPRGRRRRIGLAMGLLEQSRLASCRRPGRTKSTRLTRRRIAVWRLEWPPRVPRARRDGRDGSCANGRPRDVGHRCERWRALERERDAAFEPPLASQVRLGIKQLEPKARCSCADPIAYAVISGPPVGGLPSAY